MEVQNKIIAAAATLAVALTPAVALAQGSPSGNHGNSQNAPGHTKSGGSSPTTPSSNAKAYGKYCQSESKKHVAGQKGTPFSKCVTDMAHLAKSKSTSARAACANESKRPVTGQKGTPFSNCIVAAAQLRKHTSSTGSSSTSSTGSTGKSSS